jgi:hypothetical protein
MYVHAVAEVLRFVGLLVHPVLLHHVEYPCINSDKGCAE